MTASKPLPEGLALDVRHLVAELRVLKDRADVSLAALAQRTPYSKSSWERYLNGKALPPQHAVVALGTLAGADPARLTALWELASAAWHESGQGRQRGADDSTPVPEPGADAPEGRATRMPEAEQPAHPRRGVRPLVRGAVALVAAAAAAGMLFALLGSGSRTTGTYAGGARSAQPPARQLDVNCFGESCTGKDPAQAGCGDVWTAAESKVAGVYVELRYSDACKAAWSRISWGRPGDVARVVAADGRTYANKVHYDTDVFSAMVSAPSPSTAKACMLLTSGVRACTGWGGTEHLTEAPNPPASLTPTGVSSVLPR